MRPRLATKFLWTVLAIVGLSIVSSLVALYGTWRVAKRLEETAEENLPAVRAEEVQIMLSERDVLLAAHLLDKGNSVWLDRLHEIKPRFQNWLNGVKTTTYVPDEEQILLTQLERAWTDLDMQQKELVKVA